MIDKTGEAIASLLMTSEVRDRPAAAVGSAGATDSFNAILMLLGDKQDPPVALNPGGQSLPESGKSLPAHDMPPEPGVSLLPAAPAVVQPDSPVLSAGIAPPKTVGAETRTAPAGDSLPQPQSLIPATQMDRRASAEPAETRQPPASSPGASQPFEGKPPGPVADLTTLLQTAKLPADVAVSTVTQVGGPPVAARPDPRPLRFERAPQSAMSPGADSLEPRAIERESAMPIRAVPETMPRQAAPVIAYRESRMALGPATFDAAVDAGGDPEMTFRNVLETGDPTRQVFATQKELPVYPAPRLGPAHPDWAQALGERVLMAARGDVGRAKILMNPDHLGQLDIEIRLVGDQAQLTVSAQHSQTRDLLDAAIPRLREMLAEDGVLLSQENTGDETHGKPTAPGAADKHPGEEVSEDALSTVLVSRESVRLLDDYA